MGVCVTVRVVASPTINNSNRLIGWLRGMDELKRSLNAAQVQGNETVSQE